MLKKDIKKYLIYFLVSFVVSDLLAVFSNKFFAKVYGDNLSLFFYLLIFGFPAALPYLLLIYFFYLFSSIFFLKKINPNIARICFLIAYSIFYLLLILKLDWLSSRERYHSFDEFIREPNLYLMFSCTSVLTITVLLRNIIKPPAVRSVR